MTAIAATATHNGRTVSLKAQIKSSGWAQYVEITGQALAGAARRLGVGDWRYAVGLCDGNPNSMRVEVTGIATDGKPLRGGAGMVAWVE